MKHPDVEALAQQTEAYIKSRLHSVQPYTAEEYFAVLLDRAARSSRAGDYGISAALIVRYNDVEIVSIGRNTVISARDPFGHAEANSIRQLQRLISLGGADPAVPVAEWTDVRSVVDSPDGPDIFLRPASPSRKPGSLLYTTLEPCPMCTVAILNSRVERVIIAVPDEPGGALAPERLVKLPGVWPRIAAGQGLRVSFTSFQSPGDADEFISPELTAMLRSVFWDTKAARDAEVARGILLRPGIETSMRHALESIRRNR